MHHRDWENPKYLEIDGLGKSNELENVRLNNPYRVPKVEKNPIPTPQAEGWIFFQLEERGMDCSISFSIIYWISIP